MPRRYHAVVALAALAVLIGACAAEPVVTPSPATPEPGPTSPATEPPGEAPFQASAWPADGSACGRAGYTGSMGRIEAVNARTVRYTLCAPDGAFPARIADPSLGILDAAAVERMAADPGTGRSVAGTGPYRIERWDDGEDLILAAARPDTEGSTVAPTIVLRWATDPAQRTFELLSATVDAIDAPSPADLERIATLPELATVPRPGLATGYLAFGNDRAFDDARVRRAFATSLDREALAAAAFPAGSTVPTHLSPCAVPGGCAGEPWPAANAPAAKAELQAAGFDLADTRTLHVPSGPVAGLPDPRAAAEAIRAQLAEGLGLSVEIDIMDPRELAKAAAEGTIDGMYLWGIGSSLADPSAFLGPVFGRGTSLPATRTEGVREALREAAATADAATREAAFARANNQVRDAAAVVPLVSPGSVVAARSDVGGVVTSPLGADPLGAFAPGDRRQLVFMQAAEPAGAWCADQRSADALRLCALVTDPLYEFAPGTLRPEPSLADRCTSDADATTWTCRLRDGVTFHDGAALDAGDVLATYQAQWDAASPLRTSRPDARFAWDALFGAPLAAPSAEPSPTP